MKHIQATFARGATVVLLSFTLFLAACSGEDKKEETSYIEGSVETLYNTGMDYLQEENFKEAAVYFNEVERQHPYSIWATKAQLMAGYAYYRNRQYERRNQNIWEKIRKVQGRDSDREIPGGKILVEWDGKIGNHKGPE